MNVIPKSILLFLVLSTITFISFSQKTDSTKSHLQFSGAVTLTDNGVSVIPTFTLGKPAAIFDFVVRKNHFSFEPQLRFGIEDFKPWSFIFWMRYKLVDTQKFKMGIGAHPSTVFGNTIITTNGVTKEAITVRRFWAGDLNPTYYFSKTAGVGIYYLYSRGLADATKNTHFVALSGNFSHISLSKEYYLKVAPQVYYLTLDGVDGYYATSTFTLAKNHFPFTISSIVNKKIQSTIPSDDFLWNLSLTYSY